MWKRYYLGIFNQDEDLVKAFSVIVKLYWTLWTVVSWTVWSRMLGTAPRGPRTGLGLSRANVLIFTALTPSLQIIWGAERWNNGSSVHSVQQHPEAIFNRYSISYCPSTFSAADQLSYFHYIGNTHWFAVTGGTAAAWSNRLLVSNIWGIQQRKIYSRQTPVQIN